MIDKKMLVISNMGLSKNESNGRVLSLLLDNFNKKNLHCYCLGGFLDLEDVNYIELNDKSNLKMILSLSIVKPVLTNGTLVIAKSGGKKVVKQKKAIHYFIRNVLYSSNIFISHYMKKYIKNNGIECIFLFGGDAPYLYRLASKLSKIAKIPLFVYTCEDYPIKNYNYIERGAHNNNFFFKLLIHSLNKRAKNAFESSTCSFFNSHLLLKDYNDVFNIKKSLVRYLPSNMGKIDYIKKPISRIVYGGNIVIGRIAPLLSFAKVLNEVDKNVVLDIYGKINGDNQKVFDDIPNINYHGIVPYDEMVRIYKNSDLLLHVEGFDDYHLMDYRHSFSTKIGDCYKLTVPFLMYSPYEIASTQYGLEVNEDFTATSEEDLFNKLEKILHKNIVYKIDYNRIENDFKPLEKEDFSF